MAPDCTQAVAPASAGGTSTGVKPSSAQNASSAPTPDSRTSSETCCRPTARSPLQPLAVGRVDPPLLGVAARERQREVLQVGEVLAQDGQRPRAVERLPVPGDDVPGALDERAQALPDVARYTSRSRTIGISTGDR